MARRRFRWTRDRYRKAQHLARLVSRWVYDLPSDRDGGEQFFVEADDHGSAAERAQA